MSLQLHGIGHWNPANEITNRFLEELDTPVKDADEISIIPAIAGGM